MRTSVPAIPAAPSLRAAVTATAAALTLRPVHSAIPMNPPGIWFARTLVATLMAVGGPPLPGTTVTKVRDGAVRGDWVRAPGVAFGSRAVYYIHGSGYVLCSARTHRSLAARLSKQTGLPVFVIDYRLAPEHPFPAAADDVEAGYRWLRSRYAAADLVLAGDSAGGHLIVDLLLENDRHRRPQPAAVALFSPLLDLTFGLAATRERSHPDPLISARAARELPRQYTAGLPDDAPRLRLRIPKGTALPPILVQAGGAEMLAADARELHAMVRAAGGEARLELWPGQVHVFQALPALVPEADQALARAAEFLCAAQISTVEKVS
ncbi:alpha/beta hydrolase [Nocardia sp. NPDC127579]|uniref:alpha/beta hydrolase n=1 Tax=Nocardia sp. NPDC127579 TaxID=3345402 RepID=UPI003630B2F4